MKLNKNSGVFKIGTMFMGNIVSLFVGMLTAPVITRLVAPAEYGQLSFFTMYINIFIMFSTLGLERSFIRYYYDVEATMRSKLLYDCIKGSALFLLCSIPITIFAGVVFDLGFSADMRIVIPIFICNAILLTLERFSQGSLRIQQKVTPYVICNIVSKLSYALLAILLITLIKKQEFILLIISTTIANLLSFTISVVSDKKSWDFGKARSSASPFKANELLRYGMPLMVHGMIAILFQSSDKIMLKHFSTFTEVGIYASAGYFLTLCNVFATSISTITGPEMYKYNSEQPGKKKLYEDINTMMSLVMFFISFSLIFSKDLLVLLLGEEYVNAGVIMPFLMIGPVMVAVSGVNSIAFEIKKKTAYYIVVTSVSAIVNIIGNYFLVPLLGGKGAAISTGLSYIVYFCITTILAKKLFNFNMSLWKFFTATLMLVGFATYNTFIQFNLLTGVFYFLSVIVLFFMYRNGIKYTFDKIKEILKRK